VEEGAPGGAPPSVFAASTKGLCPRCGSATLFDGLLRFADKCRVCGLNLSAFNVGDGPAALLTLVIGALITGLAIWVEVAFQPPLWLHAIIWVPITVVAVLAGLRLAKAWLLCAEYRSKAREAGRGGADHD
jgi:uncharacterized protein (DUF983 family)